MKRTILFIFLFIPALLSAINAPVTTAGSSGVCPGVAFPVPITVTGFTQITAMTLRLDYDPTLMTYTGFANVNSSLAGVSINMVPVSPNLNKVLVAWTSVIPLTLASGIKMFDFNFTLVSGSPVFAFNNTDGGGSQCEYADVNGVPMNDLPSSSYYINATITNLTLPQAGPISGSTVVCTNQTGVIYSIPAIPGATSYSWTVPAGAAIISGGTTNTITVNYSASATSGNITASGINNCGPGPSSSIFVTLNQLPGAAGSVTGTSSVCAGVSDVAYMVNSIPNAVTYIWLLPPGAMIVSGAGTNSILVSFSATATSGNIIVYGNNPCGNGSGSPAFQVTVDPLPDAAGPITGPESLCSGDSGLIYFTNSIPNAASYIWTVPPAAVITSGSGTSSIVVDFPPGASSGPATVYGINSCGSGAVSPSLNIVVYPIPPAPTITFPNDTLHSSSASGNQWYLNQNVIPGATSVTFVPSVTGHYSCKVNLNGCSSDSSNSIYVIMTGLKESGDYTWGIFPNPSSGTFKLFVSTEREESFSLKVYNNLGSQVNAAKDLVVNSRNESWIDLYFLPDGMYYIILINKNYTLSQKIIIKH